MIGAFPSDKSFMRLGVSILMGINEEWMTTIKYCMCLGPLNRSIDTDIVR